MSTVLKDFHIVGINDLPKWLVSEKGESTGIVYLAWHISLWYLTWTLINVFLQQFFSRGVIERRRFFDVVPKQWTCYATGNLNRWDPEWAFSPCSGATKVMSGMNVSGTDSFYCFKFHNVTLSTDSELTAAISVSFAIYLFAVAALSVGFKVMAGVCTSRKESYPNENPTFFMAKLLSGILAVYCVGYIIAVFVFPEDFLYVPGQAAWAFFLGLLTLLCLPVILVCCEFGLEEDDIAWQYINIPESEADPSRSDDDDTVLQNSRTELERDIRLQVHVPDSDRDKED